MFFLFFWMSELGVIDAWAQPMSAPLPEGYVVHLPQQASPEHLFEDERHVMPEDTVTGCEQKELTCLTCGATRVTVIPKQGDAWREWRARDAVTQSERPIRCTGVAMGGAA